MDATDRLLVTALGSADGIFLPVRNWSGCFAGARHEAIADYRTTGVPVLIGGADAARKSGQRLIAELVSEGLVVRGSGGAKAAYLKLTVAGETRARALAGLPNRDGARGFLAAVAEIAAEYVMGLAPEVDFYTDGGPGAGAWDEGATREDRRAIAGLENVALPSMHAGWVEARSTIHGHVCYVVTDAGRAELEHPTADPAFKLPDPDDEAGEAWRAARDAKLAELAGAVGLREIGELPLPLGGFLQRTDGTCGPIAVRKAA